MKILSWNVQGFGTKNTRNHLKDLIRANDPDIIFLCETKSHRKKMQRLVARYNYPNILFYDPIGYYGGLCLLWKDGTDLTVVDHMFNIINCLVKLDARTNLSLFTCMYGKLNDVDRENQWNYLIDISVQYNYPWILAGDLNFILNREEKEGGITPSQSSLDANNLLIDKVGLVSLPYIGNPFTWTNRRDEGELILERLDRFLASLGWMEQFPNLAVYHLVSIGSDHCPILLTTSRKDNSTQRPFRFNKAWLGMTLAKS